MLQSLVICYYVFVVPKYINVEIYIQTSEKHEINVAITVI